MRSPGIVVIGASIGGLEALKVVLGALPAGFGSAVAVAHHRGKGGRELASRLLSQHVALPVREAEDKESILAGRIYLAPPDYHLLVERDHFALSVDPAVKHARPSIDVLFESAAESWGARVVGVLLTGASEDGTAGLAAVRARGGRALVQDPGTAEDPTMPRSAITAGCADEVFPLEEIGARLAEMDRGEIGEGRHGGRS